MSTVMDSSLPSPPCEATLIAAMTTNGRELQNVAKSLRTYPVCLAAVTQHGCALRYVPKKIQIAHPDVCRVAVTQYGFALGGLKHAMPELYPIAVANCGEALGFVPVADRTPEICDIALNRNPIALMWIPEHLRTAERCATSIAGSQYNTLRYVPAALQTTEMCLAAVRSRPQLLADVHVQTPEICLAATENGKCYVLRNVRDHAAVLAQYPDFYSIAIRQHPYDIADVPEQTSELCLLAVSVWGQSLRYIKEPTYEVCLVAVQHDPRALRFVPPQHQTRQLLAAAGQ